MRLRCSTCYERIEWADTDVQVSITCPNCGSQVSTADNEATQAAVDFGQVVLGRFELLEQIGQGGFATVWKAHDRQLDRLVALKLPRSDRQRAPDVARFIREAKAAARLQHPNVVSIFDVGQEDGQAFLVSEFVEGFSLQELLEREDGSFLQPRRAAEVAAQVADGLDHAHQQGIVHRDIKPSNILIDREGRPRITDFGLAKREAVDSTITQDGKILGTPAYMPPEQARGEGHEADGRADIYSLGGTLFRMLSGRLPFRGTGRVLNLQVLEEPAPRLRKLRPDIPRDLETIVLKCLEKTPQKRYPSAGALAADLRRYLNGQPIVARPIGMLERGVRWVKARPAAAAAAWLTLACMVLMGAVLWLTAGAGAGSKDPPAIPPRIPESQQARLVAIETEPPDALVAVVRVSDETGEPDPNDVLRPSRRTPLSLTLEPGRYLLEVEVPDHGFHQVYRTVPSVDEKPLGPFYFHSSWELDGHIVKLPVIRIPRTADVIKDMEWLEGGEFTMGSDQWMIATFPHRRKIEAYYLDRIEVTIGQARRVNLSLPEQLANLGSARDDDPLTYISHTAALHYAEIVGKRLPTEAEYEYPATNRGADPFPWGQEVPAIWDTAEFWPYGPVAARAFDVTRLAPSIRGLYSGVAEWTDSMYTMYPGAWEYVELQARQVGQMAPPPPVFRDARVIRGGGMAVARGEANEDVWHRDARWREAIFKEHALPGLGFRCARSAAPRYVRAGN